MSHPEQREFFRLVAEANRGLLNHGRAVEIGSYDVNGTMRSVFEGVEEYVGVDLVHGPGVDVVGYGHEVAEPDASFDVALSGECFEHDPHWRETFANMVRMTRPGGLVAFTCASHGRPEHGTRRSDVTDSPATQAEGMDYYRNLVAADFESLPLEEWFDEWRFWSMPTTFDLYFAGRRAGQGDTGAALPQDADVDRIRRLLPIGHRAIRMPLRVVSKVVHDEDRYQKWVMPYWLFLLRRSEGRHRSARTRS
jgi:SAM-dependent methyltransferase